jgi:hypothetical protein
MPKSRCELQLKPIIMHINCGYFLERKEGLKLYVALDSLMMH